jgi:hypothetical protein
MEYFVKILKFIKTHDEEEKFNNVMKIVAKNYEDQYSFGNLSLIFSWFERYEIIDNKIGEANEFFNTDQKLKIIQNVIMNF